MPETDSARLANCGILPEIDFSNKEPLQELKVGDVFRAADFPVTVTEVKSGSNGVFTGEGWIPVGWILNARFGVEFKDLTINSDKIAIEGTVDFKYNQNWKNVANLSQPGEGGRDNTRSGITRVDVTVDFAIPENPNFEYNDSTGILVIYDTSGTPHEVNLSKNEDGKVVFPVKIKDANGNVYEINEETYIDEDGNEKVKVVVVKVEEEGEIVSAKEFSIFCKDTECKQIDTIYIFKGFDREIKLEAKELSNKEWKSVNIDWTVNDEETKTVDFLSLNMEVYNTDLTVSAKKSEKYNSVIFIVFVDIDIEQHIIATLLELLDLEKTFNNIVNSIDEEIEKLRFDPFFIKGINNEYVARGMSKLLEKTSDYHPTNIKLFNLIHQLYETDVLIERYDGNFDKLINKINSVISKNETGKYTITDVAFRESVISEMQEILPVSKEDIEELYISIIKGITIKKISADE
jgi:hypothetical protein